jgi:hypothetical protein
MRASIQQMSVQPWSEATHGFSHYGQGLLFKVSDVIFILALKTFSLPQSL